MPLIEASKAARCSRACGSAYRNGGDRAASALDAPENEQLARLSELLQAAPASELGRIFESFSRPSVANLGREKLSAVLRFLHDHIRAAKRATWTRTRASQICSGALLRPAETSRLGKAKHGLTRTLCLAR